MPKPERSGSGLEARRLSVRLGQTLVVQELDLTLPEGALTVLVGPNGSGKSTVLRALARLIRPAGGAVFLDGEDVARLPAKAVARRIGVLVQSPAVPEGLTVRALVEQGRYPHRSLVGGWTAADETACTEAMSLTGVSDLADRPLEALSGGQRQRAWIAMTLAQGTDILLLDEPTTYLDIAYQIEVLDLVSDLVHNHGKTVLAVLHDLNQAARYADRLMMLDAGRIVADGPPAEVMTAVAIASVFKVAVRILVDPETGAPYVIPTRP